MRPDRRVYHQRIESESGLSFFLRQTFKRFEPGVWLRTECDYEIDGKTGTTAELEPMRRLRGVATPRARLQGWTRLMDYQVNKDFFDYAYLTERTLVLENPSGPWDKLLEDTRREVALTRPEERVYDKGIAWMTKPLERHPAAALWALYHEPRDKPLVIHVDPLEENSLVSNEFLRSFIANSLGFLVDSNGVAITDSIRIPIAAAMQGKFTSELWANRVDALHFGLRWKGENYLGERTAVYAKAGYNSGSKRWFSGLGLGRVWDEEGRAFSKISYRESTQTRYFSQGYTLSENSYPFLLSLDDYFDFYWRRQLRLESGYRSKAAPSRITAGLNLEEHSSLEKNTDFNLLCTFQPRNGRLYDWLCRGRELDYRPNPAIDEGRLHSLDLALDINGEAPRAAHNVVLEVEHSAAWLGSDFPFTRFGAKIDGLGDNYAKRWFKPAKVRYRLVAGAATGDLPVQRYGAVDASVSVYAPFGTFKTLRDQPYEGARYGALFWQQDWAAGPLKLLGWSDKFIGLGVHGASGRTWIDEDGIFAFVARTTSGWHHEVGISFALFKSVNLHATRRLDGDQWYWGISFD